MHTLIRIFLSSKRNLKKCFIQKICPQEMMMLLKKNFLFFKIEDSEDKKLNSGYELIDKYVDQTDKAVEGSGVLKLNSSDKYILMYDVFIWMVSINLQKLKILKISKSTISKIP